MRIKKKKKKKKTKTTKSQGVSPRTIFNDVKTFTTPGKNKIDEIESNAESPSTYFGRDY